MMKADLERVRDLALERLATGSEPPWVWYQLMKLREASEALIAGMDATQPMEDSLRSARRSGAALRLVAEAGPQESVPPHQDTVPVRLPT